MDARNLRAIELEKLAAEPKVDATRLDLLVDVGERIDLEIALFQSAEDVGV